MSIDFQIKGNFRFTKSLKTKLLNVLPQFSKQKLRPSKGLELAIVTPLVSLNVFYSKKTFHELNELKLESTITIFFSINDKDQIIAATNLVIIYCKEIIDNVTDDLIFLINDDIPLLSKINGKIFLFIHNVTKEFWFIENRKNLIGQKFSFLVWSLKR